MSTRDAAISFEGKKYFTGFQRAPVDHRDVLYSAVAPTGVKVPTVFDTGKTVRLPIYDQNEHPACVGWTLALVKTFQEYRECKQIYRFDGLKIYNLAGGGTDGITMRAGLDVVRTTGAPYSRQFFKIGAYAGINPKNHEQVKHAVVSNGVLLAGFMVPASFMGGGGKEFKDVGATGDQIVGGHAIAVVGYEEAGPILHNSWGYRWGNKGRATVTWAWWDRYVDELWSSLDLRNPSVARRFARARKGLLPK